MDARAVRELGARLKAQIQGVVVGHDDAIELLLASLLCEGHVLLEGVPGTAKTLLARTFASGLTLQFSRIQFTPDLMPGDVIGTNLFNFQTNRFTLNKGPVFTQLLLADEINRTPPKTQAALLQAMQERTVTIDGASYPLERGFMVIATQNPIEQQGTYPLPEAQLDRFLFKVLIDYPDHEQEKAIVAGHQRTARSMSGGTFDVEPVGGSETLAEAHACVAAIQIADEIVEYVVRLVRATRDHASIQVGASPRAAGMLAVAARALATLAGRDFVIPDDVKRAALPALRHRVVLSPGAEIEGRDTDRVLGDIVDAIPAPR